jgi:protein TonB
MKLKILFFTVLLMHFSLVLSAQNTTEDNIALPPVPVDEAAQEETFVIVEQMPEFPGGQAALMKYLSSNIKYPDECRKMGIEGKVYVKFVVDKTGSITDTKLLRGVPDGKLLENEAIRVIKTMPKWKPGNQSGKPVSVYFTLPISFKLNSEVEKK